MQEINWHPEAEAEYLEILNFWIEHNQSANYSLKIINEVENAEELLKLNPEIGAKVKRSEILRRLLILRNFSLFYIFQNNSVTIISFKDNRENPEKTESLL